MLHGPEPQQSHQTGTGHGRTPSCCEFAGGGARVLPVLAMTCGYSRVTDAVMIPSRKAGDILAGMREIIGGWGRCPRNLLWDREAAIGGNGRPTVEAAAFAGTLGVRIKRAPPRDPETKGLIERRNGYFETSFLPGRSFVSPFDFNAQIEAWLTSVANARHLRSIGTSPGDPWATDCAAMVELPPVAPMVGLTGRSGRRGTTTCASTATTTRSIRARSAGSSTGSPPPPWSPSPAPEQIVATHERVWASGATITDPEHKATARTMRAELAATRHRPAVRSHPDGHVVAIRALPDYDALFGVAFDPVFGHTTSADPGGPTTAEGQ